MTTVNANTDIDSKDLTSYDEKEARGAALYVNERVDGSIDTNVAWSPLLTKAERHQLGKVLLDLETKAQELDAAAKTAEENGQPNLAKNLRDEAKSIRKTAQGIKDASESFVPHHNGSGGVFVKLVKAKVDFKTADKLIARVSDHSVSDEIDSDAKASGESTKSDSNTKANALSSSYLSMEDDDLLREMESDPKAFYNSLADMDSKDRQAITLRLNQIIQSNNQTFSAISNMLKAQHDTQKAILANLRV